MPIRSLLLSVLMMFLWPWQAMAAEENKLPLTCLQLGSNPSLIVKFNDVSSKDAPVPRQLMRSLESSYAEFTKSKAMSGGAYVVYFKPTPTLKAQEIRPGCYAKTAVYGLMDELKARRNVEYVDPNLIMSIPEKDTTELKAPTNNLARLKLPIINPLQWDMLTPPAEPGGMDVENAFTISMGIPSVNTAVLDTGILNNDALNPNVLAGVTFNAGNHGIGATPSCDCSCTGYDHGTHVSGTIASSGTLAYGLSIFGVAPHTKILPVNVFTKFFTTNECAPNPAPCLISSTSDQINALNWLAGDPVTSLPQLPQAPSIQVLNMSFEGQGSCGTSMQTAINRLINNNVSIMVAAGNGNVDMVNTTPANCVGVMPVAATDRNGYGASYSNYGSLVKFAAPGGDLPLIPNGILSTIKDDYGYNRGTSMAAPHASGLAALMNSIDPTLTPATILSIMQSTARAFPSGGPGVSCTVARPCGAGILDAFATMEATQALLPVITWPPSPVSVAINSSTQVTVNWQSAFWNPARTTPFLYTVNLDGSDVADCTLITTRSCVLPDLIPDSPHTVYITAVDNKQMLTPVASPLFDFNLTIVPPTVISVIRDSLQFRLVYVNYSSLGSPLPADSYVLNNAPGVLLTLDTTHSRFILNNVESLAEIPNVTISAKYGSFEKPSDPFTIPAVNPVIPILTYADRNPLLPSQVFIYYSTIGGPPPDNYIINNVPTGAVVSVDAANQRFVIDNVTNPRRIPNVYLASAYGSVNLLTNYVNIPSIL